MDGQTMECTVCGYSIVMNEKSQGNRGRFFVLLHVLVVGKRDSLHRGK